MLCNTIEKKWVSKFITQPIDEVFQSVFPGLKCFQTTKDTVASRQLQLSDLNKKAVQLPSTFTCSKALELVTLLNFRMICLERRLDVLSSAVSKSASSSFRQIQSKKFATVEDVSQYVADLECLSGILDDMEKEVKLPLLPDCSFDFSNTADEDNLEVICVRTDMNFAKNYQFKDLMFWSF